MHNALRVTVIVIVALAAFALPGTAAAQAPTSQVTISGFVDTNNTWSKNLSMLDGNVAKSVEKEWYTRTRVRPDITAVLGKSKFVLGLEIDAAWGQTGNADTTVAGGTPQRFGTSGGWDLNTDGVGLIEVKWAYTEIDAPLVPLPTRIRLGAQPFQTTYKGAVLANGDFAGVNLRSTITPAVAWNFTYGQLEEQSTGRPDNFVRGDDNTIVTSLEITPFKGLDLRPIYSFLSIDGNISAVARMGRGGVSNASGTFPAGTRENRHTLGLDARWSAGAFSFDPTILYQFGSRQFVVGAAQPSQDMRAWLVDLRGGWQAGPLRLEGAFVYTTGNSAREDVGNPRTDVNFYQVTDADASYFAGWAEIIGINVDYNSALFYGAGGYPPGINFANSIGYDKYGLTRVGGKVSYALTPAFSLRGAVNANWTAQPVDTRSTYAFATGLTPSANPKGRESYLGTEVDLGFTYKFAPGIALDVVGAYLSTGKAFARADGPNPEDVQMVATRLRYTF